MATLTSVGNSKTDWKLRFDVRDYPEDPILAPFSAFCKEIKYSDYTEPIQIDSARLMHAFFQVRSADFRYYFYMLARLERNSKAVNAPHNEMRQFFGEKWRETVTVGVARLVKVGLILPIPDSRTKYIINPVYAWKGNRLDYLDLSSFEDRTGL